MVVFRVVVVLLLFCCCVISCLKSVVLTVAIELVNQGEKCGIDHQEIHVGIIMLPLSS